MIRRRSYLCSGLFVTVLMTLALVDLGGMTTAGASSPTPAPPQESEKPLPKYVGAKNCKLCHVAPSTGNQFKIWSGSPHAKAFEVLGTDKAKEVGKAKGIADPQKAPECLKCHVTGHGLPADRFGEKYSVEEGVSCESCHGAGEFYAKKEVFEKGKDAAIAAGLILPEEKVCKTCHNPESPSYKEFNFEEFKKKIAHPKPVAGGK